MRGYDKDNIKRNAHAIMCSINVNLLYDYTNKEEAEKTLDSLQRVSADYNKEKEVYKIAMYEENKNQNQNEAKN